jgi:hypothetical protein
MFTGFASENTPAIKVWNFFNTFQSTAAPRSVSLPDDCAPIQVFKTGATTTAINVYLPASAPEGKQITIVNTRFGNNNQSLSIRSSDVSQNGSGTQNALYTLGPGGYLVLTYSKDFISFGTSGGVAASGWISLNYSNQTAASYGSIAIGESNSAAVPYASAVGGNNNTASGTYSGVFGGASNTASSTYSAVVGGGSNTASNAFSGVYAGNSNQANSTTSTVVGGSYGTTRSIVGNFVTPASDAPVVTGLGGQQLATLLLGRETIDATATRLTSNSSAAATTNQVILPNNSAYTFQGTCIANVTAGGTTSGWKFEGVIKRGANAASTALVAAVTPTVIAQDVAAATWVLAITADTTNGGIAVTVTGAAATTIRWVVQIETTEVTF